jgi:hypothetical protein
MECFHLWNVDVLTFYLCDSVESSAVTNTARTTGEINAFASSSRIIAGQQDDDLAHNTTFNLSSYSVGVTN